MSRRHGKTETYAREWRESATDADLAMAVANLESAVALAREAGRPVTADAIRNEARDIEIQRRRQLARVIDASRNCVACPSDEPGIGVAGL